MSKIIRTSQSKKGLNMTPNTGVFLNNKPIDMQAYGYPCTKFVVPSVIN